jgi:hypothetical protein
VEDDDVELLKVEIAAPCHTAGIEDPHVMARTTAQRRNVIENRIGMTTLVVTNEENGQARRRDSRIAILFPGDSTRV